MGNTNKPLAWNSNSKNVDHPEQCPNEWFQVDSSMKNGEITDLRFIKDETMRVTCVNRNE